MTDAQRSEDKDNLNKTDQYWFIHGLWVTSELPLRPPCRLSAEWSPGPPGPVDVMIQGALVPTRLTDATLCRVLWQATHCQFLLKIPGVGRILVSNGRRIDVQLEWGVELAQLEVFIWNEVWFALLAQRGLYPIHASVIALNNSAVALLGAAGSGKSLFAAAFVQRGFQLVCDRICLLAGAGSGEGISGDSGLEVWPGFTQLALWPDSIASLTDSALIDSAQTDAFGADSLAAKFRDRGVVRPGLGQRVLEPACCADSHQLLALRKAIRLSPLAGVVLGAEMVPAARRMQVWRRMGGLRDWPVGLRMVSDERPKKQPDKQARASTFRSEFDHLAELARAVELQRVCFDPRSEDLNSTAQRIADLVCE